MNPRTWAMAIQVRDTLGVRSICVFNDHRDRLLELRQVLPQRKAPKR